MTVRPIRITGDPVLHSPAAPVTDFDDALRALVADMIDTMHAAPGVGLAGPQVGVAQRLFVWEWSDDDGVTHSGVAINPELWISPPDPDPADVEDDVEGCLSIPSGRAPLRRADRALLRAQDADGAPFEIEAEGWLARIFQHEYDHLDGILYADRLEDQHWKTIQKLIRKRGWGAPGLSWNPAEDRLED